MNIIVHTHTHYILMYFMVCFLNNNINTQNICCFTDQGCVESATCIWCTFSISDPSLF